MRKYHRVFLFCFGAVCFSLLVYYKHEYDKVADVLRTLDTFGDPAAAAVPGAGSWSGDASWLLARAARAAAADAPVTQWQAVVGTSLHLYSALVRSDATGGGIHTVVVSVLAVSVGGSSTPAADQLMCWLWSERQGVVAGRPSLAPLPPLPGQASFTGWQLNCSAPINEQIGGGVYAVGVASAVQYRSGVEPVLVPVILAAATDAAGSAHSSGGSAQHESLGVCVAPEQSVPTEPARLAEFVAFHSVLGVTHMWLYEPVPSLQLLRLLRRWSIHSSPSAAANDSHLSATGVASAPLPPPLTLYRLSWQWPVALHSQADREAARQLLRRDCVARAAGRVRHVVALNVSQYLVPETELSVPAVYQTVAEQLRHAQFDAFTVSQETFCTDAADGVYASHAPFLLISTKTLLQPLLTRRDSVLIVRSAARDALAAFDAHYLQTPRTQRISQMSMTSHLYTVCGADWLNRTEQKTTALRHKSRLFRSMYYRVYRQMRDEQLATIDGATGHTQTAPLHSRASRYRSF